MLNSLMFPAGQYLLIYSIYGVTKHSVLYSLSLSPILMGITEYTLNLKLCVAFKSVIAME